MTNFKRKIQSYLLLAALFFGSLFFFSTVVSAASPPNPPKDGKSPVDNIIRKVETETYLRLKNWRLSTDGKNWRRHRFLLPIERHDLQLKTTIKGKNHFAGVTVYGTPLYLKLTIQAKGFCTVKVHVNNRFTESFDIDASTGIEKELEKQVLISTSSKPITYNVRLDIHNKGLFPPRKEPFPPRKSKLQETEIFFKLRGAALVYPASAENHQEIKDWLASMKTANTLLNPDLRRFTYTGTPHVFQDNRDIPAAQLEQLNGVLEESVLAFNLDALRSGDGSGVKASISKSYQLAKQLQEYAKTFKVYLIGNSHIDIAWLWRIYETMEVASNTFDTVIQNMTEYPELRYAQSQALTYHWIETQNPALFQRIKGAFQKGKWEIVGGMWVEPDCNLISGESWVRQILYGKNYFKDKFGIDVKTGWNVDSFGYNWNMPQIYRKSGIHRFVTQKIRWNDTTVFPHYVFWWQGVDGSRLLSYFPPIGYTSRVELTNVTENIAKYHAAAGYKKSLILYGVGDHGGGPNREILDRVRKYQKQFITPEFIHSPSRDFLDKMEQDLGANIPVWRDELYLEYHRGVYTSQAKTKKNNRKGESGLATAEKLASIAALNNTPYPKKELEAAWKLILTNQFHDILPGTSIPAVYRDADESYAKAARKIARVQTVSLRHLAARINTGKNRHINKTILKECIPVVVFNPLSWKRTGPVTIHAPKGSEFSRSPESSRFSESPNPSNEPFQVLDYKGNPTETETWSDTDTGQTSITFIARNIPSIGYRLFYLQKGKSQQKTQPIVQPRDRPNTGEASEGAPSPLKIQGTTIENRFYKITVNPVTGNISSFFDKARGKEFIRGGNEANILQVYEDIPEKWDAWNIGYTGRMWELNRADAVELVKSSPVRIVLRVKKSFLGPGKSRFSPTESFPSSFFTQDIILYRDMDRVDIETEADWWEDQMFLKAVFPVDVESDTAAYEIPFAAIDRTTKFDTPWEKARFEVPALRWADLSQSQYGISLLNDCKHGYDIHGNVMKISLLRAPIWPDPAADRGKHRFTYSLYSHKGNWNDGQTVKRGRELNNPLIGVTTDRHQGTLPEEFAFFHLSATGVILDTIKRAEKGDGFILRLYESNGKNESAVLTLFKTPKKIFETDLMERETNELKPDKRLPLQFKKFEIKTLKIIVQF